MTLAHGSLFTGFGGFDLAAEMMGWKNIFHCEIDPFCKHLLKYYWPESISYEDIKKTDFTVHRGHIDILTGGFPCQPYSVAGKRKGTEDDRHLWPEMLRAIREIQPRWIVGENVFGLISWNGGLVFDEVQDNLEAEGYEVQPFILPACAVNAPHRRDRIWFVAYSNNNDRWSNGSNRNEESQFIFSQSPRFSEKRTSANTDGLRLWGKINRIRESGFFSETSQRNDWENFPTQPPICGGDDGIPSELDNTAFSKWRRASIKGYGNAVVPQIPLQIFKAIEEYEYKQ